MVRRMGVHACVCVCVRVGGCVCVCVRVSVTDGSCVFDSALFVDLRCPAWFYIMMCLT